MGDFGLGSLGAGLSSLKQGPAGRERERGRDFLTNQALIQHNYQKKFAKKSLIWEANQLKELGINPAGAMGGAGTSYKPVMVGDGGYEGSARAKEQLGRGLGKGLESLIRFMTGANLQRESNGAKAGANVGTINASGDVKIVPSEVTSSAVKNKGIAAGVKPGKAAYVDEWGGIQIAMDQELAEAMESAGIVDKVKNMFYDVGRSWQMMSKNKKRMNIRDTLTQELQRTGKLNKYQKVIWSGPWQRFTIVDKPKSSRPLIPFKSNEDYIDKRNKREGTDLWW